MAQVVKIQSNGIESSIQILSSKSCSEEFSVWKFRMVNLLQEFNCWDAVSQDRCLEWTSKNIKSKSLISKCISDDLIPLVRNKSSGKDIWEALVNSFEKEDKEMDTLCLTVQKTKINRTTNAARDHSAFVNNSDNPEELKEMDKCVAESKTDEGAKKLASKLLFMKKLTELLSSPDLTLREKARECYIEITSRLAEPQAKIICEMFGQALMCLAFGQDEPLKCCSLWILGNLCMHAHAVLTLEPMGILDLFASVCKAPLYIAQRGVEGLAFCAKHISSLYAKLGTNVTHVVKTCHQVLGKCHQFTRATLEAALEVIKSVGNVGRLIAGESLRFLFSFFSNIPQIPGIEKITHGVIEIMKSVGDSQIATYITKYSKSINKAVLYAALASVAGIIAIELATWFKEAVLDKVSYYYDKTCTVVKENPWKTAGVVGGVAAVAYVVLKKK